ncbi:uncharacterized protein [Triticum aestivum]|uniref:uncharacterized protein isoform X2 n=1 Tax=Triticum aestivum TaxID=4565 RepID=UPI001D011402|nr:uncharacterized protein LOC123139765 isoform X2 [Triticum aestivum]
MAAALVRALRGRRGPAAAAMALGRRGGLGGADASPSPLLPMRRSLASGNGAGGTGAGGHGAGTGAVSSGCTGMGAEAQWHCKGAGGGVVANSGGDAGEELLTSPSTSSSPGTLPSRSGKALAFFVFLAPCRWIDLLCRRATEIHRLRKDLFEETRRLWDGYHKHCDADRKLFEELAHLEMENAMNMVNAKENLVSTTYKVLGCAALFIIGVATLMGPYIHSSMVHDTVIEVEQRLKDKFIH